MRRRGRLVSSFFLLLLFLGLIVDEIGGIDGQVCVFMVR